ncbi:MAG: integrase, partial [Thalassolituus sp.]
MLTDSKVKALSPKDKSYKVSDTGGLFLLINPNGAKYWRVKYRFLGKEKLLSLGVYPEVSLAKARKGRDDAKEQLRDGIDPSLLKQQQKALKELGAENSFTAIALEWHKRQQATWAPITATRIMAILER